MNLSTMKANSIVTKAVFGLALSVHALHAFAGEKVNETMSASPTGYVEIKHMNGSAQIKGWDKDEVKVTGELSDSAEDFIFEKDGDEILIKVKYAKKSNWSWGSAGDRGDDLVIYVPMESKVHYNSVNANMDARKLRGQLRVDVVNGNVEMRDVEGYVRAESVNGGVDFNVANAEVKIETVNGSIDGVQSGSEEMKISSVNGSIEVTSSAKEVYAESVNGDITLNLAEVEEVNLDTVNGSVEVAMTLADNGDVRAASVGGKIELAFQQDVSARFEVEAHAGGRITNELSNDEMQKAKYGPRRWLDFSLNNGEGRVEVSTVSGRVKLIKK